MLEPKPITYPLGFGKMEKNLGETKEAFSKNILEDIEDLAERVWAQQVLKEFIALRHVNGHNLEIT
jgi:hypothetical protein